MTVAEHVQPDNGTQGPSDYKTNINSSIAAAAQITNQFAGHESSAPDMTVTVEPGQMLVDGAMVVQSSQQVTGTITAPSTNPRIDRVVIDASTGVVAVVTGTEAASPSAPAIPAGKRPVCQVALATTTTAITNSLITDERPAQVSTTSLNFIGSTVYQSGTSHDLNAKTTHIILELVGGGAGGSAAVSSSQGGGGGGAGAYVKSGLIAKTGSVDFVIGSGGSGGTYSGGRGSNGSATTALSGAYSAGYGFGTSSGLTSAFPGLGSSAITAPTGFGGDGGAGQPTDVTLNCGGCGGSSHFSGGGDMGIAAASVNGGAGKLGAGGGGGGAPGGNGGNGGTGAIIIHEYGA